MKKSRSFWKEKQAIMAAALGLATYIYNSILTNPNDGPVVEISTGLIRGNLAKSRDGRVYAEFVGIPFALPPVNQLRFEPPQPAKSWKGTRDATRFAPECMQIEAMVTGRIQGEEDCLYLNVYTPKGSDAYRTGLLPVLVFFHGGLFISGGAKMYGAKYFMDEDVILVVPQYRLGALGFLNSGDQIVTGNMGLKDQTMALRWIQKNIKQFGGNSGSVTIMGNSAGGSSVHFHMLSPFSKGLFHRGISESGTAIKIWTLSRHPVEQAKEFATQMNCPTHTSSSMIHCLKRKDARELVKPHLSTMSPVRRNTDLFVPTIDGSFIPDDPLTLLKNGSFHKIPWISGVNSGDGLLNTGRILASDKYNHNFMKNWNKWMPLMLDYDPKRIDVSAKIRQYYFGNFKGKDLSQHVENITNIYSDWVYFYATRKAALMHAKYAPTYLYYYSYPGEFSFFSLFKAVMPQYEDLVAPELKIAFDVAKGLVKKYIMRSENNELGPCHADELPLLFNMHRVVEASRGTKDYFMSRSLVKTWSSFAKNIQPLTYQNILWPRVNTSIAVQKYINLDKRGKVIDEPFKARMDFWKSLNLE